MSSVGAGAPCVCDAIIGDGSIVVVDYRSILKEPDMIYNDTVFVYFNLSVINYTQLEKISSLGCMQGISLEELTYLSPLYEEYGEDKTFEVLKYIANVAIQFIGMLRLNDISASPRKSYISLQSMTVYVFRDSREKLLQFIERNRRYLEKLITDIQNRYPDTIKNFSICFLISMVTEKQYLMKDIIRESLVLRLFKCVNGIGETIGDLISVLVTKKLLNKTNTSLEDILRIIKKTAKDYPVVVQVVEDLKIVPAIAKIRKALILPSEPLLIKYTVTVQRTESILMTLTQTIIKSIYTNTNASTIYMHRQGIERYWQYTLIAIPVILITIVCISIIKKITR